MIMYLLILIWLIQPLITIQLVNNQPILQEISLPKNLIENQTIRINCALIQGDGVEFEWYFNGEKIAESNKRKIKTNEESSDLVIKSLSIDDIGNFQCVAKNEFGVMKKDIDDAFNG